MKQKVVKPDRNIVMSLKKALRISAVSLVVTLIAAPVSAYATSNFTPVRYPFCSRICPPSDFTSRSVNRCCPTPDRVLREQFRGNPPSGKSLNDRYLDNLWPLVESKIVAITNNINLGIVRQTTSRGSFMNAQNNNASIASVQKGAASAARKYAGSESLCRFATLSQGLAASEANTNAIKYSIAKQSIDRQLLVKGMASSVNMKGDDNEVGVARGQDADKYARWLSYKSNFCDPTDYSQGRDNGGVCQGSKDTLYNKDINFGATVAFPLTLDIGPQGNTDHTAAISAMADNLYGHDLINNLPDVTSGLEGEGTSEEMRKYMLLRSVIAKRAIAENSFSSLTALKAKGTPASARFTQNLMMELGISKNQAESFVGDNPSYYAQMEALTRKLYQSPVFYTNLMDGPANVGRQQASMKSLELMQQRDIYKSIQRSEMLMATLLEIYLSRSQGGLDKQLVKSQ